MSRIIFESPFAPYICGLIEKKRADGFVYKHAETMLHLFDLFCVERGFAGIQLTQALIDDWTTLRPGERNRYQSQRLTYVRQLAIYMASIGIDTLIPEKLYNEPVAELRTRPYSSSLAPYIQGLVDQKRANGYAYNYHTLTLYRFDQFCVSREFNGESLPRELVMDWAMQYPGEGAKGRNQRISCIRQLAYYMLSLGKDAYIPKSSGSEPSTVPHILTKNELQAFFYEVDRFAPDYRSRNWMAMSYSVLFRLYYCCGLRLQEGCRLRVSDVDLSNGRITINDSKRKDRIVFMADDMLTMCRNFDREVRVLLQEREWFFPAINLQKPLQKTNMDRRFKYFWDKTPFAGKVDREPSIHALRHTHVVHRINDWMRAGDDFHHFMPYLSRHLGHKTLDETYYYYHLAISAFDIIRKYDVTSANVIPEVQPYEE